MIQLDHFAILYAYFVLALAAILAKLRYIARHRKWPGGHLGWFDGAENRYHTSLDHIQLAQEVSEQNLQPNLRYRARMEIQDGRPAAILDGSAVLKIDTARPWTIFNQPKKFRNKICIRT